LSGSPNLDLAVSPWLSGVLEATLGQQRRAHGLLIQGPVGVGKTNFAAALGAGLLGAGVHPVHDLSPDMASASLKIDDPSLAWHTHPDLRWLAPERAGGTIGVDQVRALSSSLSLTSHSGQGKVAIVLPAEAMTLAAANALLKTLEEPTTDTHLLLVSHRPGLLPATILSRCQRLVVQTPERTEGLNWLCRSQLEGRPEWARLLHLARLAPWRALELQSSDYLIINEELKDVINSISRSKTDPVKVAAAWAKADTAMRLDWLIGFLERSIREAIQGRNGVTELDVPILHNANQPGKLLFRLLDDTRRLRDAIGTGINMELALRALLQEFVPQPAAARK
jgi:DNA polymerase-3 subunit delta'